jgi:hypothetical protein
VWSATSEETQAVLLFQGKRRPVGGMFTAVYKENLTELNTSISGVAATCSLLSMKRRARKTHKDTDNFVTVV